MSFLDYIRRRPWLAIGAVVAGWLAWFGLELASVYVVFVPVSYLIDRLPVDAGLMARQVAGVLFGVPRLLAVSIGTGWIVGRIHRPHQMAAVLIFFATYVMWEGPWLWRLVVDVLRDSRYISSLLSQSFAILVVAGGLLLGGKWSAPPDAPYCLGGAT